MTGLSGLSGLSGEISSVAAPPIADFTASDLSDLVPFDSGLTSLSVRADTYLWEQSTNAGQIWTRLSTDEDPGFSPTDTGSYSIRLTVSGPGGTDSKTRINYITGGDVPVAGFTVDDDDDTAPFTVNVTDTSGGFLATVTYDYGDGDGPGDPSTSHEYSTPGTYTLTQTVTSEWGTVHATHTITVN